MMADMNGPGVTAATSGAKLPSVPVAFAWAVGPLGATLICRGLHPFHHGWTTRSHDVDRGSKGEWEELAAAANVELEAVIRLRQVHGAEAVHATAPLEPSREADAAITREPGLLLTVQVADCVPLLIGDPETGGVASVHAGWRGTAAGIAVSVIAKMTHLFSSDPRKLVAAIGPSIGPCCYKIGPELRGVFLKSGWAEASVERWFHDGHERRLDLWQANADQLISAGMAPESVAVSELCTACHPAWFHSYRRDRARAGRLTGFIRAFSP
jgi:polyphenol oxidase